MCSLQKKSEDSQSHNHLRQRLAVAMQSGNVASVLGTIRLNEDKACCYL